MCVAHLYGVALYYLTNWAEGVSYSRPEVLYFWVYYVGFNAPWATVPLCKFGSRPPFFPLLFWCDTTKPACIQWMGSYCRLP